MSRVFISYSSQDENIAKQLYDTLLPIGAEPFLASVSIEPGSNWTDEIFKSLEESDWVSR